MNAPTGLITKRERVALLVRGREKGNAMALKKREKA